MTTHATATATVTATAPATFPRAARPAEPLPPPARWAVWVAHLMPLLVLPSGLWRLALALGLPAGYIEAGFESFRSPLAQAWLVALTVLCEVAALLTLGLVSRWGEVLPRRVPFMGGRTVRPGFAVGAALTGAAVLAVLWTPFVAWWSMPHTDMTAAGHFWVGFVYLPLVLWAPLLVAVTLDHRRRTRQSTHL
ncbi:hypothetical protein [Streptomyces sp. NPDC048442]|uniref:hypothetical protein n=1 Tax=Streptomyces sp. NPDC048442 TaxID=3154823 RepID=UPI0034180C7F